jgi:hypothetical protein
MPQLVEKGLFAGLFAANSQECTPAIPHDSHPDGPKRPKWAMTVAVSCDRFAAGTAW